MTDFKKANENLQNDGYLCGTLRLIVEDDLVPGFFYFLQKGMLIKAQIGCSIKSFLCEQIGMEPSYIEERVQTCFLNGKAVDDMDSALIKKGSILSLSGAMPGLLGATLRKGSYYASMREQVSYQEEADCAYTGEGEIRLKLFNMITREIGPGLLRRGGRVDRNDLEDFFGRQGDYFRKRLQSALLDDKVVEWEHLASLGEGSDMIFLQVQTT